MLVDENKLLSYFATLCSQCYGNGCMKKSFSKRSVRTLLQCICVMVHNAVVAIETVI